MAVNNHSKDSNDTAERDLRLGRIYKAAGDEAPSAALDAAILAAARREVGAGPAAVGSSTKVAQARRQWFVPVSLAAVLMLSVSLVSVVRMEKGDDLAQAPASAPAPVSPPAPVPEVNTTKAPDVAAKPADAQMRDTKADTAMVMKEATEKAKVAVAAPAPAPATGMVERKQRAEATKAIPSADTALTGVAGPSSPAQVQPKSEGDPYSSGASAPGNRSAAPTREAEAARDIVRAAPVVVVPAPAVTSVPPAAVAEGRRAPTESTSSIGIRGFDPATVPVQAAARPAPAMPDSRVAESKAVAGYAEERIADGVRRRAGATPQGVGLSRPAWLTALDNQPAGKWLEALAELRRDGRSVDAELLLAEFRKKFPDHPASR